MKRIGKVALDYSNYMGMDLYSDGDIEEEILEASKNERIEEMLLTDYRWPVLYHLSEIRENVLEWCNIQKKDSVLEIGSGCGGVTGVLSKKAGTVTCVELSERRSMINAYRHKECDNITIKLGNFQDIEPELDCYDVITLIGVLEYSQMYISGTDDSYLEMLKIVRKHLNRNGKLIIAIENKMGLKYWNGALEDHLGTLYSGLNDYIGVNGIRTFTLKELTKMLDRIGFSNQKVYYPIPDYKLPEFIYSDKMKPYAGSVRTYKKVYDAPRLYNFYEDVVNDQLCNDDMFGYMANSFVICAGCEDFSENTVFAKYNRERRKEYRISTIVTENKRERYVIKSAITGEAINHIIQMKENEELCRNNIKNLACVEGKIINNQYVCPFVQGVSLDATLYEYRHNGELFMKKVKDIIHKYFEPEQDELVEFQTSEQFVKIFGNVSIENAKSRRISNIDMNLSNIKVDEFGKAYLYDFEWVFNFTLPYKFIIYRAVTDVYYQYRAYLKLYKSMSEFLVEFGFGRDEISLYEEMEKNFYDYVYGNNQKELYTKKYQKQVMMINTKFC